MTNEEKLLLLNEKEESHYNAINIMRGLFLRHVLESSEGFM